MLERALVLLKPGYTNQMLDSLVDLLSANDFVTLGRLDGKVLSPAEGAIVAGGEDKKDDIMYLTRSVWTG